MDATLRPSSQGHTVPFCFLTVHVHMILVYLWLSQMNSTFQVCKQIFVGISPFPIRAKHDTRIKIFDLITSIIIIIIIIISIIIYLFIITILYYYDDEDLNIMVIKNGQEMDTDPRNWRKTVLDAKVY